MSDSRLPRSVALADHVYRWLLVLYPARFRCAFGAEMAQTFRDACREAYRWRGAFAVLRLWPRTLGDLARSAAAERFDKLRRPGRGRRRWWRANNRYAMLHDEPAPIPYGRLRGYMRHRQSPRTIFRRALVRLFQHQPFATRHTIRGRIGAFTNRMRRITRHLIRRLRGLPDDPRDGPFASGVREPRRPRPPFMPPRAAAVAPPMDPAS